MPNVEFSEEQAYTASLNNQMRTTASVKGLRALPIRLGLAKDEAGADIVLIGVAILAALLAVAVFFFTVRSSSSPTILPAGSNGIAGSSNGPIPTARP